ncbi:unnamed protein product [Phyllotreta striolata]|uniref:Uncharacterized protein n=1 Tax=Phyllotreta striolata TaxID=444603 RepID=A0A9N9TU49_PHYSR|nr:unnamed protein product [Phyllotreta striolata]
MSFSDHLTRIESVRYVKKSNKAPQDTSSVEDFKTPLAEQIPDHYAASVPDHIPKITIHDIPTVRKIGVKETIKILAKLFDCNYYTCNYPQFWFLDFITDCLWKVQDEFQFPVEQQIIILEWILYIFNLIRAPRLNLSRSKFFQIFEEILKVAEEHIESGCEFLPLPDELVSLKEDTQAKTEDISIESSSSSLEVFPKELKKNSYLAVELDDGTRYFEMPSKIFPWDTDDDRLSSTVETVSENEIKFIKDESIENIMEHQNEKELEEMDDEIFESFYKPDSATPSRFGGSDDSSESDSLSISYESENAEEDEDEDVETERPTWIITKTKASEPCPATTYEPHTGNKVKTGKEKEEEAIQAWYDYHLWQFRKRALDDSKVGLAPSEENIERKKFQEKMQIESQVESQTGIQHKLWEYVNSVKDQMTEYKENRFVNTCVLMAIKDIVYNYFYDSFQFSVVSLTHRYSHVLITQRLNTHLPFPKMSYGLVSRPQPATKTVKRRESSDSLAGKEKKHIEIINWSDENILFPLNNAVNQDFFHNLFPAKAKQKKN